MKKTTTHPSIRGAPWEGGRGVGVPFAEDEGAPKLKILREKYPRFFYRGYSYEVLNKNFRIFFDFKIEPNILFRPLITIKNINKKRIAEIGDRVLNNLVFHLGMIEIPTYWKATCSPEIKIQAGNLDKSQIKWWKNLIMKGMGQFFYQNKIDFRKSNFLNILLNETRQRSNINETRQRSKRMLVPVGGGKDSVVTLEILKKAKKKVVCFSLNPTLATKKIFKIANCKNPIVVERKIDRNLLKLNQKGFLNGHTPFSAYLAFLSVFLAVLFDYKYIAFSNERSSNEGNVKYLGQIINHQWSKSFEFENLFRQYSKKYLAKDIEYFSFLRPLYEIQIARLFSKFPKYFPSFISCNVAFKTFSGTKKPIKRWCKNCPKCLFVFASLYPFIKTQTLIRIFGGNLFDNRKLLPTMLELMGLKKIKPFECVGTKKESQIAFYLSWRTAKEKSSNKLPYLLRYFEKNTLNSLPSKIFNISRRFLLSWDYKNNLTKEFEKILKNFLRSLAP